MNSADFVTNLGMLLRDQPRGVTAELDDKIVAYWDGDQVQFAFLREDDSGLLDEGFDLDDYVWDDWAPAFTAWLERPRFKARSDLLEWLADAPPVDSGI
ncbi:hypothetical protein [Caballeronia sp. LZ034LL]|uniref:hypothetical protein n=1 Tax=Caballeronia sp. LZ034LL TaxID=3038567 RepID=UPI0028653E8E|nr:hypothetical protein [Caballeronia sp. LZ034LL]MDR5839336.1 hypothetical protein [Caballeronia sp. LZ034LL]